MFTLQQIQSAHSKVKSGADFPDYVQDLIKLGVTGYDLFVHNGQAVYFGENDDVLISDAKYDELNIAEALNKTIFEDRLKAHQRGETDYPAFCKDCADNGIQKWTLDLKALTCIYFDVLNNKVLEEKIPG